MLGPVERGFYRLAGIDPARDQNWFAYTIAMVVFSVAGIPVALRLAAPAEFSAAEPAGLRRGAPDLAFNTSASFITNTNWQNYGGETTMSHLDPDAGPHRA